MKRTVFSSDLSGVEVEDAENGNIQVPPNCTYKTQKNPNPN